MNPYTYKVSFRLHHPSLSLKDAYQTLREIPGIIPGRLMDIGEERTTPKGERLEGRYTDSRCGFGFTDEWQSSDSEGLPSAIRTVIDKISPYKVLLDGVSESGGTLEFFIGLGVDANSGITLDWNLLERLAGLRIELGFDLYPPDQKPVTS